ncbi:MULTISPECIES: hypothetical protein [Planktothrix]|nr:MULTISPECIES: hypothetical protein [Planktothrix]
MDICLNFRLLISGIDMIESVVSQLTTIAASPLGHGKINDQIS